MLYTRNVSLMLVMSVDTLSATTLVVWCVLDVLLPQIWHIVRSWWCQYETENCQRYCVYYVLFLCVDTFYIIAIVVGGLLCCCGIFYTCYVACCKGEKRRPGYWRTQREGLYKSAVRVHGVLLSLSRVCENTGKLAMTSEYSQCLPRHQCVAKTCAVWLLFLYIPTNDDVPQG